MDAMREWPFEIRRDKTSLAYLRQSHGVVLLDTYTFDEHAASEGQDQDAVSLQIPLINHGKELFLDFSGRRN